MCSFNKNHLFNMTQLNIKKRVFQREIHTLHFKWVSIHFLTIQLLKMIKNCCITLNGNRHTIFHLYSKSWKFQDNEIYCHQLAWSMNQLDYNIHGYVIFYIFALIPVNLCCDCDCQYITHFVCAFTLLLQCFYRDVFTVHVEP